MALTKAVIINLDAPPGATPLPVMFNPPKYSLSKTNQFAEIKIPGLASSVLQFVNGDAKSLSLELFFDTTDSGLDVRSFTAPIANLTEPGLVTHAPPRLLLLWASLAFSGYLISVRQEFDYFDALGVPLRARLTVDFKGHDTLGQLLAAQPLALVEQTSRYVVKLGDTLQGIAAAVYQDPGQWRKIAQANGIDDPRAIPSGLNLQVPGA